MRSSMFLLVLCCLVLPCALGLADDEPPYMDTLRQIVYETNQYLVEKHLDVVDVPPTEFGNFFSSFKIIGGNVGNFSTAELNGESYLNQTDDSSYYFSIGVGLKEMKIQVQYKAKLLGIFSSSAWINIINTGNSAVAVGVVTSTGKGAAYKCQVHLESVNVKKVGEISLTVEPSSIFHWVLERSSNLFLRLFSPFASSTINSTINKISEQDQVKELLTTIMCRYF